MIIARLGPDVAPFWRSPLRRRHRVPIPNDISIVLTPPISVALSISLRTERPLRTERGTVQRTAITFSKPIRFSNNGHTGR
jgi:hypothetical protein